MPTLIDSSLWIDFTRERSPQALKKFIAPYILAPDTVLAEPVMFEILRYATDREVRLLEAQFNTVPLIATPQDLWTRAAKLGQACRKKGVTSGALDLLICAVAGHHDAELVTFDGGLHETAATCGVRVKLLQRPSA